MPTCGHLFSLSRLLSSTNGGEKWRRKFDIRSRIHVHIVLSILVYFKTDCLSHAQLFFLASPVVPHLPKHKISKPWLTPPYPSCLWFSSYFQWSLLVRCPSIWMKLICPLGFVVIRNHKSYSIYEQPCYYCSSRIRLPKPTPMVKQISDWV